MFVTTVILMKLLTMQNIWKELYNQCRRQLFSKSFTSSQYNTGNMNSNGNNTSSKRKFTVVVEGNIGCGKSTLLDYFKNSPTVETLQEPVDRWTNLQGHNALKLLYDDPERWSFMFNNYVMLSRLQMHKYEQMAPVKMIERSLHSTHYIFVKNSYQMGAVSDVEYCVLEAWFNYLLAQPALHVDLFVYLRVAPEVCYQRMGERNRKEEAAVSLDFVRKLHNLYEDWLVHKRYPLDTPVLILDGNPELLVMHDVYEENRSRIVCDCT